MVSPWFNSNLPTFISLPTYLCSYLPSYLPTCSRLQSPMTNRLVQHKNMTYSHLFNGKGVRFFKSTWQQMTGYYHVQDHSGFLWTMRSYMMWNCCVIKMAKLQKKQLQLFFLLGCETEPNPLLEFEIFTTLFKILPSNWTNFWSRDDALSPCFGRGHAWHLDTNTPSECDVMQCTTIQLFLFSG